MQFIAYLQLYIKKINYAKLVKINFNRDYFLNFIFTLCKNITHEKVLLLISGILLYFI